MVTIITNNVVYLSFVNIAIVQILIQAPDDSEQTHASMMFLEKNSVPPPAPRRYFNKFGGNM
jgi:hypothetical protein